MNDLKSFFKSFPKGLWLLITIVFIVILALPVLLTRPGLFVFSETGQIGDTIGGTMGPFIAIVAAFLTFIAFWAQFVANNELIKENCRNHFENRFYKMLDIHLQNVTTLNEHFNSDQQTEVKSCFKAWCLEIENLYNQLSSQKGVLGLHPTEGIIEFAIEHYKTKPEEKEYVEFLKHIQKSEKEYKELVFDVTYALFYNSNFSPLELFDNGQSVHVVKLLILLIHFYEKRGADIKIEEKDEILGRYFRHLFQIVKYVDEQPKDLYNKEEWKSDYIGLLRSQMSDYEQLLLYYNAQSPFGRGWDDNHYIENYKLIKNIPYHFILMSAGVSPIERYRDEIVVAKKRGERFFEKMD